MTFDLLSSYWQVELDEKSRHLTTFTYPGKGQFEWTVAPMGLKSSSDVFNRIVDEAFGTGRICKLIWEVDDICLYADTEEEMLENLRKFLQICEEYHITLSPKKIQFAGPGEFVIFAGMKLSEEGCSQDPDKMRAILDFP